MNMLNDLRDGFCIALVIVLYIGFALFLMAMPEETQEAVAREFGW